jgi:hypothetical protein
MEAHFPEIFDSLLHQNVMYMMYQFRFFCGGIR